MQKIILIGGGGHCKSCIDTIEAEKKYQIYGILDIKEKIGENICGYKIIGTDEEIEVYAKRGYYFLITIGQIHSAKIRVKLFNRIKEVKGKAATVISPSAYVSRTAKIGEGTIILNQVLVNSSAKIGSNCIINSKALIEHDAVIGNHCHISTGAKINGGVEIGEESFIGSGAITKQYIKIEKESFVKAGSLMK